MVRFRRMETTAKPFKRNCEECEERYQPTGRYQTLCDRCKKKRKAALNERNRIARMKK